MIKKNPQKMAHKRPKQPKINDINIKVYTVSYYH